MNHLRAPALPDENPKEPLFFKNIQCIGKKDVNGFVLPQILV